MIFDLDAGEIHAAVNRDLRWLVGGSGGLALILIGLIAVVVRTFVLRRLQRFETTARQIADGDLGRANADRGVGHRVLAGPRVQHHGRFDDRPGG